MIFQLLPQHGPHRHFHRGIVEPRFLAFVRQCQRKAVAHRLPDCFFFHQRTIRRAAHAREHIVPTIERLVQRLTVIAVFDIQIDKVSLLTRVERKIILSDDADLRRVVNAVHLHPIFTAALLGGVFRLERVVHTVFLGMRDPSGYGAAPVADLAVLCV